MSKLVAEQDIRERIITQLISCRYGSINFKEVSIKSIVDDATKVVKYILEGKV